MNPIVLNGLDHIVLRTANVEAMVAFYCDTLGCLHERALPELGLIQLRAGASLIDLVAVDSELGRRGGDAPGPDSLNMDHFCLQLGQFDEDAIRAHLNADGVNAGPAGTRYGALGDGPSIYINDPDGNTVELKGPPV
jgi:glyoxylase I family protein